MLDVAVSYNRYRFLGREFLTWLWYALEQKPKMVADIDPQIDGIEIGNRMVLENRGPSGLETITIKGDDPGLEEGLTALKKGALVSEMSVSFSSGDQQWRMTLKGESLFITGLKVPETGPVESDQDIDGALLEKTFLVERAVKLVDALFARFIRIRISSQWQTETVSSIRKWIGI
jgi:hypothetical protein